MRKKILVIAILLLSSVIITGVTGCHKDKGCKEWEQTPIEPQALLNITWKCVGFVNTKSCKIKKPTCPEYRNCENDYTFTFTSDTVSECNPWYFTDTVARGLKVFYGRTSSNSISGTYEFDCKTGSFHITIRLTTLVGETSDGYQYCDVLPIVQYFSLQENEMRLYYNNKQNYLLFKPQ